MRTRALIAYLLSASLLTACVSRPDPLEVGTKEIVADVEFGGRKPRAVPPPPALNLDPGFPLLIQPPRRGTTFTPPSIPPPRGPCPSANPLSAPRFEAQSRAPLPPVEGSYRFRNTGGFENTEDGVTTKGTFPATTVRIIKEVTKQSDGSFGFKISESMDDAVTETLFEVVPDSPVSERMGVFVRQIATQGGDSFSPLPPIRQLAFPTAPDIEWDSVGSDPLSQWTMRFHARVGLELPDGPDPDSLPDARFKQRIDACGEFIDTWLVQIKDGEIIGVDTEIKFKAVYAFAPQYGGLAVMEDISIEGVNRGVQVKSHRISIIGQVPEFPGATT